MRDRAHLDRGDHRLAELAPVEQLLEHAHRLVEAHVLVDRQHLAGNPALLLDGRSLEQVERHGLLSQDRLDVWLLQGVPDEGGLLVGRVGDVDDLDRAVLDQLLRCLVDTPDAPALRHLRRLGRRARRDRNDREPGLGIGRQMHVGHDEAGADAADLEVAAVDHCVRRKAQRVTHSGLPRGLRLTSAMMRFA